MGGDKIACGRIDDCSLLLLLIFDHDGLRRESVRIISETQSRNEEKRREKKKKNI